jgi:hypothetical protein
VEATGRPLPRIKWKVSDGEEIHGKTERILCRLKIGLPAKKIPKIKKTRRYAGSETVDKVVNPPQR